MKYAKPDWREGQPYSTDFNDVYFSADNGVEETEHVFIQHNQLPERFAQCVANHQSFVIAETGFGSGLNFLCSVHHWLEANPVLDKQTQPCLYFYSVENTPFSPEDLAIAHKVWPEFKLISEAILQQYQVASYGFHSFKLFKGRVKLVLLIGEVENMLKQMQARVDAWFLDGFAPSLNPQMWSESVFSQIKRLSHLGTTCSTYTAVGDVRRGLMVAGFDMHKAEGCGNKRHMLSGKFSPDASAIKYSQHPWYEYPQIKPGKKTASIIGAGIAGLSTAWSLVERGYTVEIFEAGDKPGAQASGNPRGMLMPRLSLQDSADAEFYTSAYFYALRCLQKLDNQQITWQQTGGLQLASSDRIKKQIAEYPEDKALAQVLDAQSASKISAIEINEAVHYFAKAACLYPEKILQRLIALMGDSISISYNCEVNALDYINRQWQLKNQQGDVISKTGCLIVASAWQSKRFKQLAHLYLQPARGQLSLLASTPQSQQLRMPVSFKGYVLPESNGQHVIGASFDLDDCDTQIRNEDHQANIEDLQRWFKGQFNTVNICGGRASVRAVSPDRTPIVGPAPAAEQFAEDYTDLYKGKAAHKYPLASYLPDLYINTGHGARGFTSAFISAELLASTICNEPLPVSNRVRYALHPARFLVRSLKKKQQKKRS